MNVNNNLLKQKNIDLKVLANHDLNITIEMIFFRYTAATVLEMDFDRIDINQCPLGKGNPGPNRFADTARCKNDTTEVILIVKKSCSN